MVVVISGFSGVGKDTILSEINRTLKIKTPLSWTSRPIREGEQNGVEYNFVSKSEFQNELNNMLEYRTYDTLVNGKPDTWYYGTHKDSITDENSLLILDYGGYKDLKEIMPDRVIGFHIIAPDELREERAKKRGSFDQMEWDRRLIDDHRIVKNIENEYNYTIENIILEDALSEIYDILDKII